MVKYTGKNGKEYILRFDMWVMEELTDKYGDIEKGLNQVNNKNVDIVLNVFELMAQAGAEYLAEKDGRICKEKITAEGLISKHSSPGRLVGIMTAIMEAVKDGRRMQSKDEEDDQIRDGYLEELNKQEQEKN